MRAALLKETIKALFPLKRTLCIEGSPGVGKTSIVHQAAQELGVSVVERHMPTLLVEDFGILFPTEDDQLSYKLPAWYPQKGKVPDEGILLFDDRNQASTDLQKVLANICQSRTLHGCAMPDGWMVISTGNRQADRAGANRVLSHLRNRETVLDLEAHVEDWCDWAERNDVNRNLISFIRYRPNLLNAFDPQNDVNPTPRSWVDGVSALLNQVPKDADFECFKGAVGEGAAAEFVGYLRIYSELPDLDAILNNPEEAAVPDKAAVLYAITGVLIERANPDNFASICQYVGRMPPEFGVSTISSAVRRLPELAEHEAYAQWAIANAEFVLNVQ